MTVDKKRWVISIFVHFHGKNVRVEVSMWSKKSKVQLFFEPLCKRVWQRNWSP